MLKQDLNPYMEEVRKLLALPNSPTRNSVSRKEGQIVRFTIQPGVSRVNVRLQVKYNPKKKVYDHFVPKIKKSEAMKKGIKYKKNHRRKKLEILRLRGKSAPLFKVCMDESP